MNLNEAKQFVVQFVTGGYTPIEYAVFLQWLKRATLEELNAIADEHEALHEQWSFPVREPSSEWVAQLERKLDEDTGTAEEWNDESIEPGIVVDVPMIGRRASSVRRNVWIAAASVLVLSAGAYFYVKEGGFLREGGSGSKNLSSNDFRGRLETLTNIFSNARGGEQKQLTLADGSKVWLNAASILKYPARFTGSERLVELSGEALFVVAKSSSSPFRVLIKDAEVEALGTKFDVMVYDDEAVSRTTLIEGAVKVSSGTKAVTLNPGQQAEIPHPLPGAEATINLLSGIDPAHALGWKDGEIRFDGDDLQGVMRILSRSYNVDVRFDPTIPESTPISAAFNREYGLNKILAYLESINKHVHFTNNGKTVIADHI